ncbi:MAG: hypothetical protein RIR18_741, partial [Pseudomonadota bacterium]
MAETIGSSRKKIQTEKPKLPELHSEHPVQTAEQVEAFEVSEAISAAQMSKAEAASDIVKNDPVAAVKSIESIIDGLSPDDAEAMRQALWERSKTTTRRNPDVELSTDWREGGYPYQNLMSRKAY